MSVPAGIYVRFLLALLLGHGCLAWGQGARSASPPGFAVHAYVVEGSNPLSAAATHDLLAPFRSESATMQTVQAAVAALQAALRERGFDLHQVVLPPQQMLGTVRLEVVAVTLAGVNVEGHTLRSEERIRSALPELQEGRAISLTRLAAQAAAANLNPHRRLDVAVQESSSPGQVDATVRVVESAPLAMSTTLSNQGTRSTGRDRLTVALAHTDLLQRDHQLVAAYTTSLQRPKQVKQLGASYSVPLPSRAALASITYSRSDVVGQFRRLLEHGRRPCTAGQLRPAIAPA